jgi:hypothetical protein
MNLPGSYKLYPSNDPILYRENVAKASRKVKLRPKFGIAASTCPYLTRLYRMTTMKIKKLKNGNPLTIPGVE